MNRWRCVALWLADLEVELAFLARVPDDEEPADRARRQLMLLQSRARYVGLLEEMEGLCAKARGRLAAAPAPADVPGKAAGHVAESWRSGA